MSQAPTDITHKLTLLNRQLDELIAFFEMGHDYNIMIYELWDAKDVLGHLTFWHESFARNLVDMGSGRKPNPLKGSLKAVNKASIESTKTIPISKLIGRLHTAQKTIEQHIFNSDIELIPYKVGSRPYSRSEHLDVVLSHIRKHLNAVKKILDHGTTKNKTGTA